MPKCKYCDDEAKFALYELKDDSTKEWVQVCDIHDKDIAHNSRLLKKQYPNMVFEESSDVKASVS